MSEGLSTGPVGKQMPDAVTLVEVGPRDGFQFEKKVMPTDHKLAVINRLVAAGLKTIQVASFVHPVKVPQMADADELIRQLPRNNGAVYTALVLNSHGLDRAMASGIAAVEISLSASDTHSRKNTGLPYALALDQALGMIDQAVSAGLTVRASIQCAFGCVYEGRIAATRIVNLIRQFVDHGAHQLALADTTGMASPPTVKAALDALLPLSAGVPLALHLHDTRGLGLVNLMAALTRGVSIFDTALAGMGGCPFVAGAAGNIATEDTAHLLETLGIATAVDYRGVGSVSRDLEAFYQKSFPGRMHRMTSPSAASAWI